MKRLTERFRPGDAVEVWLWERWVPGRVFRLDHPGVWVVTGDGGQWFVTNSRRIREVDGG